MTLSTVTVYADDPDAYVDRIITDAGGANLTFVATVAVGPGAYLITATWQGVAAAVRTLRIPVDALVVGNHHLYLSIPGGNDIDLGWVQVLARA